MVTASKPSAKLSTQDTMKAVKVTEDKIVQCSLLQQTSTAISGVRIDFSGKDEVGLYCVCGRSIKIPVIMIKEILEEKGSLNTDDAPKARILAASYRKLLSGDCLMVLDNTNGHSYPMMSPLIKMINGACLYGRTPTLGNSLPDPVFKIVAINKKLLEEAPKWMIKFLSDLPVEDLNEK